MSGVSEYHVRFRATSGEPLGPDAAARLGAALSTMPGVEGVDGTEQGPEGLDVTATFSIEVRLGMADAARDGSRLAREGLKVAGLQPAQLVELSVTIPDHAVNEGGRAPG